MADALYPYAKEDFLAGNINMLSDTIKLVLVDTGAYTYSGTHRYLSDIASAARVATSAALTGKAVSLGAFSATDYTFTGLTGSSVEAFVIYQDTGSAATSRLIYYCDTSSGLPLTPNGSDCVLQFDTGSNKIFHL